MDTGKDLPLLAMLEDERIFRIDKEEEDIFIIWEECDGYFKVPLTREQLRKLADEIHVLANT